MGTRGAIIIRFNYKWYIIYNHFDSYPSGLLRQLINELTNSKEKIVERFTKQIEECSGEQFDPQLIEYVENDTQPNSLLEINLSESIYINCKKHDEIFLFQQLRMVDHEYSYFIDFDSNWFGCSHIGFEPIISATGDIRHSDSMERMYNQFDEYVDTYFEMINDL